MKRFFVLCLGLTLYSSFAQDITHVDSSTSRADQVRIAMLAAPKEVSDHANIYVLGKNGYELARRGDNGFSCLIEREKPVTMEPECYDAEGSKTTLRVTLFVEQERAQHVPDEKIDKLVKNGYTSGKFRPPRNLASSTCFRSTTMS